MDDMAEYRLPSETEGGREDHGSDREDRALTETKTQKQRDGRGRYRRALGLGSVD